MKELMSCLLLITILLAGCTEEIQPLKDLESVEHENEVSHEEEVVEENQNENQKSPYGMTQIKLPYNQYTQPCTWGGQLFVPVNSEKEGLQNQILSYDMETKQSEIIYSSKLTYAAINDLTCSADYMVWVETDEFGMKASVHAMDRAENTETIIFQYEDPEKVAMDAPVLHENWVAWMTTNYDQPEVMLYDLSSNKLQTIAVIEAAGLHNNFVDFHEDELLWTDTVNDKGKYYLYDLNSGEIDEINSEYPYIGYARFADDQILSINFEDVQKWTTGKFGTLDIDSQQFELIEKDYISRFDTYNYHIAYITKDHKLMYYRANDNQKVDLTEYTQKTVDTLDFTNEGLLVAGTSSPEYSELFVFTNLLKDDE
ncbi:hypothetical protein E6C60_1044 [Paenibacillus algicola]|uniref:Lipoprotein n=1 Tax=Paenibacillus algicola TaxID=2565926 RepID=A0A4P8XGY8_9BACL|nr:hypothetical protein [Paenibacillus algicola]QCT01762.1 hypothetical protein E6C60_1044 [Paenibacillus algicola]